MRAASLILLAVAGCGAEQHATTARAVVAPAAGQDVPAGDALQAAIAAAAPGATLRLLPGEHRGPITIDKPLVLWGPPDAVVRGGDGSTVRVKTNGARLCGFTVAGSGQRFDLMDGGVHQVATLRMLLGEIREVSAFTAQMRDDLPPASG